MNGNKNFFINGASEIVPPVNDSPYKRILAIGDVHGSFGKLMSLWSKLNVTDRDLLIFVGDYVEGCEHKDLATLRRLIELSKNPNVVILRGNTDDAYLRHMFDRRGNFLSNVSGNVVREIRAAAVDEPDLPKKIFDFMNALPYCHSVTVGGRKYFFCHGGVKVGTPLNMQTKTYLLGGGYMNFYENYSGDALIVVGHKAPKKIFRHMPQLFEGVAKNILLGEPIKIPGKNILMLDTQAKHDNGFLTCVDVLSGNFYRSDSAEP